MSITFSGNNPKLKGNNCQELFIRAHDRTCLGKISQKVSSGVLVSYYWRQIIFLVADHMSQATSMQPSKVCHQRFLSNLFLTTEELYWAQQTDQIAAMYCWSLRKWHWNTTWQEEFGKLFWLSMYRREQRQSWSQLWLSNNQRFGSIPRS